MFEGLSLGVETPTASPGTVASTSGVADVSVQDDPVAELIELFARCFQASCNTRLVRGDAEPVYLPADARCDYHRIVFAHGFFASALHEVAHWCIAGHRRREQIDYGYWYSPDGRDVARQRQFEQVEARPQALEWIFSRAAGRRFRVSSDNLAGIPTDPEPFRAAVCRAAQDYCRDGLPARAGIFQRALARHFEGSAILDGADYRPQGLLP